MRPIVATVGFVLTVLALDVQLADGQECNPPPPTFCDVTQGRGITAAHTPAGTSFVAGIVAADFDGNGDIDLFIPQGAGDPNLLYRNDGPDPNSIGSYTNVAAMAGVDDSASSVGALAFDYDGDEALDLLVLHDGTAGVNFTLYRQNGPLVFCDVTNQVGLALAKGIGFAFGSVCAGDINNDGFIDVYASKSTFQAADGYLLLNETDINSNEACGLPVARAFVDIMAGSALQDNPSGPSTQRWQCVMFDFDGDGWTDIFQSQDYGSNWMWINQTDGSFLDVAAGVGVAHSDAALNKNHMGVALGDYDNDCDLDIFVTLISTSTGISCGAEDDNPLFTRDETCAWDPDPATCKEYTDQGTEWQVDTADWGWGATFLDADNDGFLDLAITNGFQPDQSACGADPARFFQNRGRDNQGHLCGGFVDVSDTVTFNNTDGRVRELGITSRA